MILDTTSKEFDGLTEAEFLAKSTADVARHYSVEWLDQKGVDWANLIQCLAMVYGSRVVTIMATPKARPQPAPMPANVPHPQATQMHEQPRGPNGAAPDPVAMRTADIPGVATVILPEGR